MRCSPSRQSPSSAPAPVRASDPSLRVSVVVRSMGRPCLADALAALGRQSHRPLELVVVDATGGRHPPLSALPGVDVQLVSTGRPLARPAAANAGIDAATGAWIAFLDDDDLVTPVHIERLLDRATRADAPDVVYAQHWSIDRFHRVVDHRHHGFNPLILHFYCRIPGMACLVRREALAAVRLDESLRTCEDWDFWLRLMAKGRFATVHEPTHLYFLEAGTSGTGAGRNRHAATGTQDDRARVLERHATERQGAWDRYFAALARGEAIASGEGQEAALAFYAAMLDAHPDEPNALRLVAQAHAALGRLHTARRLCLASIYFNGDASPTHRVLASICEAMGYHEEAQDARGRAGDAVPSFTSPAPAHRNAACPCGSGRRYKACHGAVQQGSREAPRAADARLHDANALPAGAPPHDVKYALQPAADAPPASAAHASDAAAATHANEAARAALAEGRADDAWQGYARVLAASPHDVEALHATGLMAWDLGDRQGALDRLAAAAQRAPQDAQLADNLARLRLDLREHGVATDARAALGAFCDAQPPLPPAAGGRHPVHIVAALDDPGGEHEAHVLGLARVLGGDVEVAVWAARAEVPDGLRALGVRPLDPNAVPWGEDATLVLSAPLVVPAWLAAARRAARVIVDGNLADVPLLLDLVRSVHACVPGRAGLVLRTGLHEPLGPRVPTYPGVVNRARPDVLGKRAGAFTLACVATSRAADVHPRDPALFRRLAAEGIAVRVHGAGALLRHFPASRAHRLIEVVPAEAHAPGAGVATAHAFFHRPSPRAALVSLAPLAAALSAGVPVICARHAEGAALLTQDHDALLFDGEDDEAALACVRRLRRSAILRARMSSAARATAERTFGRMQEARVRALFLGPEGRAAPAHRAAALHEAAIAP